MAQVVHDKFAQLVKVGEEYIAAAIVGAQTRDGKDELITGAGNMVFSETLNMWVPVSEDNPLEVRVKRLEQLIGELAQSPAPNTLQDRLKTLADRLGEAVADPDQHTLLARLAKVEEALTEIKDALDTGDAKVQLKGSFPEFRLLSSDPMPDAAAEGKGAVVYHIDTRNTFVSDGSEWQVI